MDRIKYEILEDGTISLSTDDFKTSNHVSADELVEAIAKGAGGSTTIKQKPHEFWKNKNVLRGGKVVKTGH